MLGQDTQLIELVGRHRLIADLLEAGLEVALPMRDRGVDLIAYSDRSKDLGSFIARPIQLKVASARGFGVYSKYALTRGLIIAYVWNVGSHDAAVTYALTYPEAERVATELGWTQTPSWLQGGYTTTKPGKRIIELLEQYRMTPANWLVKVTGTTT